MKQAIYFYQLLFMQLSICAYAQIDEFKKRIEQLLKNNL